jgi:MFS family permease
VLVFGVALVFFASFNMLAVALCFIAMAGAGRMGCIAAGNAFVQTNVTDNMRGRVISFYAMAFFGMQPIGNLLIGYLAEHLGVQTTLMLQGGTGIVLFFIFLPYLRKKEPVPVL